MIKMKSLLFILTFLTISFSAAISQTRIAILPFQNMDGLMEKNIWCYDLQDSLIKAMQAEDPDGKYFTIVPADEVEDLLAEYNLDPANPQYQTDLWKVVKLLNVKQVIMGSFNIQAERFLINCYIYDVKIKLPNPKYKAKDIFKAEEDLYECIPMIVSALLPAYKK